MRRYPRRRPDDTPHALPPLAFVLVAFLAACPGIAAAQPRVGFNGALTRSRVVAGPAWSPAPSFRVAGSVTIPLSPSLSIQPEAAWSRRSTRASAEEEAGGISSRISLDYIELPVLARWSVVRNRRWTPVALGGVYYALRLRASQRFSAEGASFNDDIGGDTNTRDAGLVAGGGVETPFGGRTVTLEARYLVGLSTLNGPLFYGRWRTRSFTLAAGMRW